MTPWSPKKPCAHPGCGRLVQRGRCSLHQQEQLERRRQHNREYSSQRDKDGQFYSGDRWPRFRKWYLSSHPTCVECGRGGKVVDHIKPRRDFPDLAYDEGNCQTLCVSCHNRRTRLTESGKR